MLYQETENGRFSGLVKDCYLCDHRFDGFIYCVGDNSLDAAILNCVLHQRSRRDSAANLSPGSLIDDPFIPDSYPINFKAPEDLAAKTPLSGDEPEVILGVLDMRPDSELYASELNDDAGTRRDKLPEQLMDRSNREERERRA